MIYNYLIAFSASFLLVSFLTPLIIKLAFKTGFLDNPNYRKVHKKATPVLGGLGVFLGFSLLLVFDISISKGELFNKNILGFIFGALIIVIVGMIDDRFGMKPKPKLLGQLISCMTFIYFNGLMTIFGPIYFTLPILIFWMIGLMNAFNFLDNMDGILSGMAGILALGFYGISFVSKTPMMTNQAHFIALLSLSFAGAVWGFLPHNFNPAKIFLGDSGSMFIGYFLGSMGILSGRYASLRMNSHLFYLLPVLLLSYAVFDISLVSYTRKRDGRKVTEGGKDHSTHRIGNAVGSTKLTAIFIYIINAIIVLITILVYQSKSENLLIAITLTFMLFFMFFGKKLNEIPVIITKNQLKK